MYIVYIQDVIYSILWERSSVYNCKKRWCLHAVTKNQSVNQTLELRHNWILQQKESPWAELEREIRLLGIFWRSWGFHHLALWIIRLLLLSSLIYWKKVGAEIKLFTGNEKCMRVPLPTNLPIIIICGVISVLPCFLLKGNSIFFLLSWIRDIW